MTSSRGEPELRFVFDQHMSGPALRQLRSRDIDVVHVAEVGLSEASDPDIFRWAVAEGRIVVTRSYRDFAPLVGISLDRSTPFPGILFCATSIRHNDAGAHVRALEAWIREARARGENPVQNSFGWLR